MKNIKLAKLWDSLNSSYWFIPTLMTILASVLAVTMLTIDRGGNYGSLSKLRWIYSGGTDGARSLLSSVAGSMVTVAATAFSITIVALQLASSQFGPRLLRNFMQDTGNKVVLGTFIGTFIYSLLVLRTIYNKFVPPISVTVGIVLAIVSIAVLIYFINHASTMIQANHVISQVSADLDSTIERLFPKKFGHPMPENYPHFAEIPDSFESEACSIRATGEGYVQAIDSEKLMKLACEHNLLLKVLSRPGKFVVKGSDLIMVSPGERVNHQLSDQINDTFVLGKERTEQQDVEFPILQLVEIASRALSPGINDPFTAIRCIDRLSAGLSRLAKKNFPSPYRYDKNNKLRIIAESVTFPQVTDTAFNQIRQYSTKDAAVTIHLLEAIALIANYTYNSPDKSALRRHADMIMEGSNEGLSVEQDRKDAQERYRAVIKALDDNCK